MASMKRTANPGAAMRLRVNRYGLVKALIVGFTLLYLLMVWLRPAIGSQQDEIFPFFAWSLFSWTPAWERLENTVVLLEVDGEPVDGVRYLIPNDNISDAKALRRVVNACETAPAGCGAAAEEWLFPVIRRLTSGNSVEISVGKARVDLRAAQREIQRLADGEARETDYFRPESEIGRWTVNR